MYIVGIPFVFYSGYEGDHMVLVMELLGPDLSNIMKSSGGIFDRTKVFDIGKQALERFRQFHNKGFIHRDIKPENFSMGLGKRSNTLYLFDFGLSKQYINPYNNEHIPYRNRMQLTGNMKYSSINAHLGMEQSRRDDLESLGFVMVYLAKGYLPWEKVKCETRSIQCKKVTEIMTLTTIDDLCKDLPSNS